MKKIYLLLLLAMLLSFKVFAQADAYLFAASSGTYVPITGGTLITSSTDGTPSLDSYGSGELTIPSFTFAGTAYTSMKVTSNGQIYFNLGTTTVPSSTYTSLSSSTASNILLAPFSADLNQVATGVSEIRYQTVGNEIVVQWSNFRRYNLAEVFSFQARLNTVTGVIKYVYMGTPPYAASTSYQPQIGIKSSTTNYHYLTVSSTGLWNAPVNSNTGITSSSLCTFNGSVGFSTGLTYTFTPPVSCVGTPIGGKVSSVNQIVCSGSTPAAISVPFANPGFSGYTYQWEESDDNGVADAWANVVGGTGATTLVYTPPSFAGTTNKYYRLKTTCTALAQSSYSTVHTVLMSSSPNAATALTFTNIGSTSMTIGWTNANGNRRLVVVSPVNTFVARTNGTGPAHTAATAFTGTGEQIVYDGTGSSVTVTGLTCNTTYYVQVYEYFRCGSSAPYSYWYSTPLTGNQKPIFFQTSVGLPSSTNFVGFTGSNLSTVFPGWREATGDGPLSGTTSGWTNSSLLPVATAKVNLWSTGKKEWILSPTLNATAFSRVRFKAAITDYADSTPASPGMDSDDKVEVMISSDACGGTWTPLYTFNATNTATTLTNNLTEFIVDIPNSYQGQNFIIGFKASEGSTSGTSDYDFHITALVIENTPPPTLTATKTDNICYGGLAGTATAIPKDGTPPYTYLWSPSGGTASTATGLSSGTYTVTLTDANNLTATATVTISDLTTAIVGTLNSTNISCKGVNDGSITATATGGTSPYTYLWNNSATTSSITGLAPGVYSVTITDANGCTKTESITITEPDALTVSNTTQTDVSWYGGNDGEATVTVSGGTSPYTYLWSNGATTATAQNLIAGTYTVTITDANGCTTTQIFTITQPIPLMVQSVSKTKVKCNGGSDGTATIVAIGGNAPYTYLWSPSGGTNATATGLAAGIYSVLVTDSTGNTITESFTITEPGAIQGTVSYSKDVLCNGSNTGTATISVTGGTAPFTYTWSNGISTTNATVSNLVVGNYTVQITDANGCTSSTPVSVSIAQPAAIVFTTSTSTNISCYGLNDGSASVTVSGGVAPYTYLWSNGQSGASLSNLGKGTYVVTVTDANNCTKTQSFTITEPAFVVAPTAINQNFCVGQNATLANIVISGSNIKWYSAATGGTLLPATTALVNGTTYYASQTIGTCESATRTPVQVTLNQAQALTTTQLNVCSNTRIQNMIVDGFNYTQLKWYSSSTSALELPSSTLLSTGTYYVSSVVAACESARQAIQVTVATVVPAPTASFQMVCSGSTLNDLVVSKDPSATLNWYSSMQSIIPLVNTTVVSTGTYYVQQVIGTCESSRIAVQVQVINITMPTITSITTCEGTTIADLNTNGTNYVWYTDNNTTTSLPSSFVITSGSYYIANANANCISARKNIAVNVSARPASPTGQTTQLFNFSAKVSNLKMNEPNVKWFLTSDDATKLMNELSPNTPLIDATTYYGVLVNPNNCGSLIPTAVTVTINLGNESLDLTALKYYPNPVDSELNISYIEEIKKVEIFTITGQRVFGNAYQGNEVKVDLSRLSSGTYLVKIETAKASQFVKIVKK